MHGQVAWLLRGSSQGVSGCVVHYVVRFTRHSPSFLVLFLDMGRARECDYLQLTHPLTPPPPPPLHYPTQGRTKQKEFVNSSTPHIPGVSYQATKMSTRSQMIDQQIFAIAEQLPRQVRRDWRRKKQTRGHLSFSYILLLNTREFLFCLLV